MSLIYKITNTKNNKVYIGKTDLDFETRWNQHQSDWIKGKKKVLYEAFSKYGILSFEKEIIEDNLTPKEACEREKYWIQYYDSYKNGYNMTNGGEGASLLTQTEIEEIISLYNQKWTLTAIAKKLNRDISTIVNKLKVLGFDCSSKRLLRKTIQQIDVTTNKVIAVYPSLSEAARALGDFNYNKHISEAARGKRQTAYGYKWKYIEEYK